MAVEISTDGSTPAPCDPKIFKYGRGVCVVAGSPNAVETWVRAVAKRARAKVDWYYSGGHAKVLHLGFRWSRWRVLKAIHKLEGELNGTILSIDGLALFRNGVDTSPEGVVLVEPDRTSRGGFLFWKKS